MTESDRKKLEQQQKKKLGGGCEALDGLIQQIVDKDKNISLSYNIKNNNVKK